MVNISRVHSRLISGDDITNVINLYHNNANTNFKKNCLELLKIYGSSNSNLSISPFFKLNCKLYGDYGSVSPVCELHLIRLGIAKEIIYLFGFDYGNQYKDEFNSVAFEILGKAVYTAVGKISSVINGKDISKILPQLGIIHSATFHKLKMADVQIDALIFKQLFILSDECRRKLIWNYEELNDLQSFIYCFKSNLINRFGKKPFSFPNFEGLDYIPFCIYSTGNIKITSTENYEGMHKIVKRFILGAKQNDRGVYMYLKLQAFVQYVLHHYSI